MRKIIVALAILALVAPAGAFGQSANANARAQAAAAARAGNAAAAQQDVEARISAARERAVLAGVPEELLAWKIEEGRAKGIDGARIAAAVEHRASVLAGVSAALNYGSGGPGSDQPRPERGAVTAGELVAAADAFERGVSLETLAALSASAGNDRAAALTVLADLVASGRASEHAVLTVETALGRGNAALIELGGSAEARAGAAARARAAGIEARGAADINVGGRTGG
jgi:hypothetical protein